MVRRRTRRRLEHDRDLLCRALEDCEAGAMEHLDEAEQASVVESIAKRIADIDARIRALGDA
jgi:hypothetical protein